MKCIAHSRLFIPVFVFVASWALNATAVNRTEVKKRVDGHLNAWDLAGAREAKSKATTWMFFGCKRVLPICEGGMKSPSIT